MVSLKKKKKKEEVDSGFFSTLKNTEYFVSLFTVTVTCY